MDNIDINKINEYGVHVLRAFARSLHIPSPTTKKKEELVQAIIDCSTGKTYYDPATASKKGRPVKIQMQTDGMSSAILSASSVEKDVVSESYKPYDTVAHSVSNGLHAPKSTKYEDSSVDVILVEGYLDVYTQGHGILRVKGFTPSESDAYVDSIIIRNYSLKTGDHIKGYVYKVSSENIYMLNSITSVNDGMDRVCDFSREDYKPHGNSIKLSEELTILQGSRNYIRVNTQEAIKYASFITDSDVLFLDIKAKPEYANTHSDSVTYVPVYFNKSELDVVTTTNLISEISLRHVELGKHVVLFINNFSELIKAYNIAHTKKYDLESFDYQAINRIQNILFNAKYINDKCSLTIVCVDKDIVTNSIGNVINNEFIDEFNLVK